MPVYVYRNEDGQEIEVVRSMRDPSVETVERDGKTFKRVYGNLRVNGKGGASNEYPYGSLRLKGQKAGNDCEKKDMVIAGVQHYDVPIVKSKAHEANLAAKYGLVRE